MIYGAQSDEFDFHYIGFDDMTLPAILHAQNYCDMQRVGNFNIIQDTSSMVHHGRAISLNIVSRKCGYTNQDELLVEDMSSPYVPQY